MADRVADGTTRIPGARGWKHPISKCPGCGKLINATSDPKGRGAKPREGDLTLAICCGTILRFDRLLRLRTITLDQINALPASTHDELKEQQERWRIRTGRGPVISLPLRKPQ